KVLMEEKTNWSDARERCHSEGLVLAEPDDTIAVPLTRFVLQRYGNGSFWANARLEGGKFIWQRSNKTLDINMRLRTPRQPVSGDQGSLGDCLSLSVSEEDWMNDTSLPYQPHDCSDIQLYPLCEKILQDKKTLKDSLLIFEENISTDMAKTETNISLRLDTIIQSLSTIQEAVGPVQESNSRNDPLLVLLEKKIKKLNKFEKKLSTTIDTIETGISTIKYR
ncbi:unnamed protein product, partial [Meganyctiphanes norvegica]